MRSRRIVVVAMTALAFAACNYDWTFTPDGGQTPGDGGPEGSSADSGAEASLQPGQCNPTTPCAAGSFCDYASDDCGRSGIGRCADSKNTPCSTIPLDGGCQCNGKPVDSACTAHENGFDLDRTAVFCDPSFACGSVKCSRGKEYCAARPPSSETCVAFSCTTPSCDCPELEPSIASGCSCTDDGAGGISIKCP